MRLVEIGLLFLLAAPGQHEKFLAIARAQINVNSPVNRMARLLAYLLKWQKQPGRRGASWQITIRNQRRGIARRLKETPSLRPKLAESDWWTGVWDDATAQAAEETGLSDFPEICPWEPSEVLNQEWLPE